MYEKSPKITYGLIDENSFWTLRDIVLSIKLIGLIEEELGAFSNNQTILRYT